MYKYFKMTKESLAALAGKVSGRLRTSDGTIKVVTNKAPAKRSEGLEGMFRDLIAMRTVTGDYQENHIALDYIDKCLSECAMHVNRFEYNGFESLVATTQRTLTPKVMLVAHIDIVPAHDELFKLREKNGEYHGRGVFDMKFAIPSYLQIVQDLQDKLHAYDFGIMITTDEEVGGFDGVVPLIKEGYLPRVAVVPDGGDDWKLETFCKGLWLITIKVTGKNAHGSRPWEGSSATQKIMDLTKEITGLFTGTDRKDSTVTIAMLHGGEAVNQVPDEASVSLDMRFGSLEDSKRIQKIIKELCAAHHATIESSVFSEPVVNDLKTPILASFVKSIKKVTGGASGEIMSYAGTDARHFAAKGIPCVIVRPPGGNLHGPNEWISKQGFFDLKDVLTDFLKREAAADKRST